jgi:hypothetical protein
VEDVVRDCTATCVISKKAMDPNLTLTERSIPTKRQTLVGGLGHFLFFQYIGNVIIPTDDLHHSEGWRKKHQPGQLDEFDRCEDQLLGEMFLQLQPQLSQPVFSN